MTRPEMPPPVVIEPDDIEPAPLGETDDGDGRVFGASAEEQDRLADHAAEFMRRADTAPRRTLTLNDLTAAAQLAWIRCRREPRYELERWEAVVKAVIATLRQASDGSVELDNELQALLETST